MCDKLAETEGETIKKASAVAEKSFQSEAKAKNRERHGTSRHMIDSYLCEFMWRQQLNGADPFQSILLHIATQFPPR